MASIPLLQTPQARGPAQASASPFRWTQVRGWDAAAALQLHTPASLLPVALRTDLLFPDNPVVRRVASAFMVACRPWLCPAFAVRGLVEQILKFGRVVRPVLGITIAPPQVRLVCACVSACVGLRASPTWVPADAAWRAGIHRSFSTLPHVLRIMHPPLSGCAGAEADGVGGRACAGCAARHASRQGGVEGGLAVAAAGVAAAATSIDSAVTFGTVLGLHRVPLVAAACPLNPAHWPAGHCAGWVWPPGAGRRHCGPEWEAGQVGGRPVWWVAAVATSYLQ